MLFGQPAERIVDSHETELYFRESRQVTTTASTALASLSAQLVAKRRQMASKKLILLRVSGEALWLDTPGGGLPYYEPKMARSYFASRSLYSGWFAEGICLAWDCAVRLRNGQTDLRSRVVMGKDPLKWTHRGHSYSIKWMELFIPGVYDKSHRPSRIEELLEALIATTETRPPVIESFFKRSILPRFGLKEVDMWFTALPFMLEPLGLLPWHPFEVRTEAPTEDELRKAFFVRCSVSAEASAFRHKTGCVSNRSH